MFVQAVEVNIIMVEDVAIADGNNFMSH